MITPKWQALIKYCNSNPFMTIEKLEIVNGEPNLVLKREALTNGAKAFIRIKYSKKENIFTEK